MELIQQYDKAKAADSSLTVKAWCEERNSLNSEQPSAKKAASGINRTARSTSWCALRFRYDKARPKPSSIPSRRKFERGPVVYYCDYVTNVTYKIQYKYPDCNFSKVFYRISNQNIPMAEILSELKKRRRRILAFNINEGSWGGGFTVVTFDMTPS